VAGVLSAVASLATVFAEFLLNLIDIPPRHAILDNLQLHL